MNDFIDVSKAHLNARCEEQEWVELLTEIWEYGKYARLRGWLYGVRKAAAGWVEDSARKLGSEGFLRGKGASIVFFNSRRQKGLWCTATTPPTAGRRASSRR